jgi:anti-anti-sigma factor
MSVTQSWTATQSWEGSRTAEFTARTGASATVITASGEVDAANANQLTEFVERHIRPDRRVILDLGGLEFIATAGFSALHRINVTCSGAGAYWDLVPSPEVHRLLRICDPDGTLPTTTPLTQLVTGAGNTAPQGSLQLVPQPR